GNTSTTQPNDVVEQESVDVVIVGICGPSGAGKSTVGREVAKALQSPMTPLSMDNFFCAARCSALETWETVDGIDVDRFLAHVAAVKAAIQKALKTGDVRQLDSVSISGRRSPFVAETEAATQLTDFVVDHRGAGGKMRVALVIDGFLLLAFPEVCKLLSAVIVLKTAPELACVRRFSRGYSKVASHYKLQGESLLQQFPERHASVLPLDEATALSVLDKDADGTVLDVYCGYRLWYFADVYHHFCMNWPLQEANAKAIVGTERIVTVDNGVGVDISTVRRVVVDALLHLLEL
ncbi:MAG: AAA family ATPase, partial [Flavobacteriaceae bacterium]|nr:AAA family ATPase [Flavobacteriaceae bacterium]